MDMLAPLHPVADVVDLAGEAVAALGIVAVTAASRLLVTGESTENAVALEPVATRWDGGARLSPRMVARSATALPPRTPPRWVTAADRRYRS